MTFRWECEACGELHGTDAKRCRNCGESVFRPLSLSELEDRTVEVDPLSGPDTDRAARGERFESGPTTASANLDELLGGSVDGESADRTRFPRSIPLFVLCLALALALWYLLL